MAAGPLRFVVVTLALLGSPGPASAQTLEALRSWNLFGTWAPDCTKPPALDNTHATYVQSGSSVRLHRDFGQGRDSHPVIGASAKADGTLTIRIAFSNPPQTRVNVFGKGTDGRIRTLVSHDSKGRYTIRDGKLVGANKPTEWLSRCK
jgi:hypothetical protein